MQRATSQRIQHIHPDHSKPSRVWTSASARTVPAGCDALTAQNSVAVVADSGQRYSARLVPRDEQITFFELHRFSNLSLRRPFPHPSSIADESDGTEFLPDGQENTASPHPATVELENQGRTGRAESPTSKPTPISSTQGPTPP